MKKIILQLLTLISLLIFSCSPEKPILVQALKEVDGPLRNNLTVISSEIPVELVKSVLGGYDQYSISFSVQIEVSNPLRILGGYKSGSPFGPTLEYRLLDESKRPINATGHRVQSEPDLDGIANNLGVNSNKFWIRIFQSIDASSKSVKLTKQLLQKAKFVQLTSTIQGDNNSTSSVGTANSSSVDCDQMLKAYEQFMIKYIEIIKKYKANPTDNTILSDYTQILTKNTDWSSKIASCASNQEYAVKFTEVQLKIANALSALQ